MVRKMTLSPVYALNSGVAGSPWIRLLKIREIRSSDFSLPEQSTEMVEWSAPNYKPNVPLEHREKRKEERPQKPQQIHLSEAEIQRAADRVYRILEDRIREERIRLGF